MYNIVAGYSPMLHPYEIYMGSFDHIKFYCSLPVCLRNLILRPIDFMCLQVTTSFIWSCHVVKIIVWFVITGCYPNVL